MRGGHFVAAEFALEKIRGFPAGRPARAPANAGEWRRALAHATRIHSALPFARASLAGSAINPLLESEISRETMLLGLLDLELEAALDALDSSEIPVVVLKGMDVGRRFYDDRLLRPMRDVDLLVREASREAALASLRARGFQPLHPNDPKRFRIELARETAGKAAIIELHWSLCKGDSPANLEAIWRRTLEGAIPGLPTARALSDEDCLAHLLGHAAVQHLIESPVWLNDLHRLITHRPSLRWPVVLAEISRRRHRSAAWLVLSLLKNEWRSPVPDSILADLEQTLSWPRKQCLKRRARSAFWFSPQNRNLSWTLRSRFWLRDDPLEAIRYGSRRLAQILGG